MANKMRAKPTSTYSKAGRQATVATSSKSGNGGNKGGKGGKKSGKGGKKGGKKGGGK
jgi:hypothetical protein